MNYYIFPSQNELLQPKSPWAEPWLRFSWVCPSFWVNCACSFSSDAGPNLSTPSLVHCFLSAPLPSPCHVTVWPWGWLLRCLKCHGMAFLFSGQLLRFTMFLLWGAFLSKSNKVTPSFHLSLFLHILLFLSHSFKNDTVNPIRGLPFTHIIWWPWRDFLKLWWHYHCDPCVLLTLGCLSCHAHVFSVQIFKRKNRLGTFSEIWVVFILGYPRSFQRS